MLKNLKIGIPELILLLITLCVYTHTLHFDFFIFDDAYHLAEDPNIYAVTSWKNLALVWKNTYMPVMYNFWQVMILLFGEENPIPHRLALILTHAINAIFIYTICKNLLLYTVTQYDKRRIEISAFIGTLVFIIHPTQVESLLWSSSMKGVLSTFFALLAVIIHIQSRKKHSNVYYKASILFFYAFSILTKPSSALLPLIFILFDYYIFKIRIKESIKENLYVLLFIIPFSSIYFLNSDKNNIIYVTSLWQKIVISLHSNIFYFKKLIFPFHHTLDYGNSILNILSQYTSVKDYLFLILKFLLTIAATFMASFIFLRNRAKFLPFLVFFVLINLVTGLIPYDFQNVSTTADRYMYFPLFGLSIFLAFLFNSLKSSFIKTTLHSYIGLLLIVNFIFSTMWKDDAQVLLSSYEKNPDSYMLNMGLGELYKTRDELEKAKVFLQKATLINPKSIEAHEQLLQIYGINDEDDIGLKYIALLKSKFKKLPLSLALYEVDYNINLKNYREASSLIDEFQKVARNHDLILTRIERLKLESQKNQSSSKK